MSDPIKNAGQAAKSLGENLKEKGFNPLFLLAGIPVVMLFGFCMCCGMCGLLAPDTEDGTDAPVASSSDGQSSETEIDSTANGENTSETSQSTSDSPQLHSMAKGLVGYDDLIKQIHRFHKLELIGDEDGFDPDGTAYDFLADYGFRINLGKITSYGSEPITFVIAFGGSDRKVIVVELISEVDVSGGDPKASGTISKMLSVVGEVVPEHNGNVREFISDKAVQIAYGNTVSRECGKAVFTVGNTGTELVMKVSLDLDKIDE